MVADYLQIVCFNLVSGVIRSQPASRSYVEFVKDTYDIVLYLLDGVGNPGDPFFVGVEGVLRGFNMDDARRYYEERVSEIIKSNPSEKIYLNLNSLMIEFKKLTRRGELEKSNLIYIPR